MSQQIHQSGLFYEADLLAWVENRLALADLAGHPQLANARLEALLAWRQWPVLAEARFIPRDAAREDALVWWMRDVRAEWRRELRAITARPSGDSLSPPEGVAVAQQGIGAREAGALSAYRANMQLGVARSALAQSADSEVSRPTGDSGSLASGLVQQQLLLMLGQPFQWQGLLMPGLQVFFSLYFPGPPYRYRSRDEEERRTAPSVVTPVAAHAATPDTRLSEHGEAQQWRMSLTLVAGDSVGDSEPQDLATQDSAEQGAEQIPGPASAKSGSGEQSERREAAEQATLALNLTWYQLAAPVALVVEIQRLTQPSSNSGERDAALSEMQQALAHGLVGMAPRVHVRLGAGVHDHQAPTPSARAPDNLPGGTVGQAMDFLHARDFLHAQGERLGQRIQQRANSLGLSVHGMPELVEMLATGLPARNELPTTLMQVVVRIAELWAEKCRVAG